MSCIIPQNMKRLIKINLLLVKILDSVNIFCSKISLALVITARTALHCTALHARHISDQSDEV